MSATIEAEPRTSLEQPQLPKGDPCVLVIFGATGDLTRRKLMPALFRLMCEGCLDDVHILCVGRSPVSDQEFRKSIRDSLNPSNRVEHCSDEEWDRLTERISYFQGELDKDETYSGIASRLDELVKAGASPNSLFYFSTPPSLSPTIVGESEGGVEK